MCATAVGTGSGLKSGSGGEALTGGEAAEGDEGSGVNAADPEEITARQAGIRGWLGWRVHAVVLRDESGAGEGTELENEVPGCAGAEGFGCDIPSFDDVTAGTGDEEGGAGVEENGIATWAGI